MKHCAMCDRFAVHIFFFTLKQCSNSWSIILKFQRHCGDFSFEFGTLAVVFHLDLRPEDLLALTFHSCIHACIMLLFVLLEKFLLQNTTTAVSEQSKFPSWFSTKCLWKNKWVVICAVFFSLYLLCHFWVDPALYSDRNPSLYTAGANRNHTVKE